jgi:hypothetical protein
MVNNHAWSSGRDAAGVQVDVDPTKPGHLSPAHAGGSQQQPGGVQPVVPNVVKECAELLGASDLHFGAIPLGRSAAAATLRAT